MTRSPLFWIALGIICVVALGAWQLGVLAIVHDTGYFSPVFAPDGKSVLAVRREVSATIRGFGREFFTPPARVRLHRDRFTIVSVRLSDGHLSVVEQFAPSPLEGQRIQAYHGAIYGSTSAHLRWEAGEKLEYEISVTRHQPPSARTFVVRRRFNGARGAFDAMPSWRETSTGMGGDEPLQLYGDLEVIAPPGEEGLNCAIVVVRKNGEARTLTQTSACRRKYPSGLIATALTPFSRRAAIERSELMRRTYADLVEQGTQSGLPEGAAMLEANKEMQRLGFYPKSTMLVAREAGCEVASPLFRISDDEFRFGIFQDIEQAIAAPGQEVDKSGTYVIHRDYATSKAINDYLAQEHSTFFVHARGRCWQLTIDRP